MQSATSFLTKYICLDSQNIVLQIEIRVLLWEVYMCSREWKREIFNKHFYTLDVVNGDSYENAVDLSLYYLN